MKIIKSIVLVSILLGALSSCGKEESENSAVDQADLLGIWDVSIYQQNECQDPDESVDKDCETSSGARGCFEYHFMEDGKFKYSYGPGSDEYATYMIEGNGIIIKTDYKTLTYNAKIEDGVLVLFQEYFNALGCKEYMELEKIGSI